MRPCNHRSRESSAPGFRACAPGPRPRAPGRRRLAGILLALSLATVPACDRSRPETEGLTADEFVTVVTELREAERNALETDSAVAEFERRRAEILERHGVTADELRAFVDRHHRDLPLLEAVWDSINERLKYVPPAADTTAEIRRD